MLLIAALAVVLAFAGSFVFGLRRDREAAVLAPRAEPEQPPAAPSSRGRVEVLNGGGKPGLARVATQQLRDAGFDVVQFGNAATPQAASQVLDRVGNTGIAAAAGAALGITRIGTALDTTRFVDVTIILGSDWPPANDPSRTGER